ncbi:hypothetical protein L2E82_01019 [Cichorium intybus]|uniref:Uncharacterized protein n=1 Tax=Cichorium intybus TaxID=13427 RepID=A0ACB9GXC6_CICIN|nr:hypothetical protein L2E82_01019 [Cichorium intybus]
MGNPLQDVIFQSTLKFNQSSCRERNYSNIYVLFPIFFPVPFEKKIALTSITAICNSSSDVTHLDVSSNRSSMIIILYGDENRSSMAVWFSAMKTDCKVKIENSFSAMKTDCKVKIESSFSAMKTNHRCMSSGCD